MNTGIILYESKYGATETYVQWLTEETGFASVRTSKAVCSKITKYDRILLCGGVYASGIAGLSFLRKNEKVIRNKKVAVFCVGASPLHEKALEELKAHNLKGGLKDIPLFYGRGAWDEERMSFKDRTLCKMLKKAVAKKDPATYEPWMEALLCAQGQKCDWTDRKYLNPLIAYIMN